MIEFKVGVAFPRKHNRIPCFIAILSQGEDEGMAYVALVLIKRLKITLDKPKSQKLLDNYVRNRNA